MSGGTGPRPQSNLRRKPDPCVGSEPNEGSLSAVPHLPKLGVGGGQGCGRGRLPLSEVLLQAPGRWPCPSGQLARVQLEPEEVANEQEEGCIPRCSVASSSWPRSKVYSPRVPAIF